MTLDATRIEELRGWLSAHESRWPGDKWYAMRERERWSVKAADYLVADNLNRIDAETIVAAVNALRALCDGWTAKDERIAALERELAEAKAECDETRDAWRAALRERDEALTLAASAESMAEQAGKQRQRAEQAEAMVAELEAVLRHHLGMDDNEPFPECWRCDDTGEYVAIHPDDVGVTVKCDHEPLAKGGDDGSAD